MALDGSVGIRRRVGTAHPTYCNPGNYAARHVSSGSFSRRSLLYPFILKAAEAWAPYEMPRLASEVYRDSIGADDTATKAPLSTEQQKYATEAASPSYSRA